MQGEAEAWAGGAETVESWAGGSGVEAEAETEAETAVEGPLQVPVAGSCKELQGSPWARCGVAEAGGAFAWAAGPCEGASEDGPVGQPEGEVGVEVAGQWGAWEAGKALRPGAIGPEEPLASASAGMWAGEGVDGASEQDG